MDKHYNENPVVSMKNISKRFGENQVLTNINFDLHKCEVHALLGENGAGKTTLMNILYGLFPPTDGYVEINGISKYDTQKSHRLRDRNGSPAFYANRTTNGSRKYNFRL